MYANNRIRAYSDPVNLLSFSQDKGSDDRHLSWLLVNLFQFDPLLLQRNKTDPLLLLRDMVQLLHREVTTITTATREEDKAERLRLSSAVGANKGCTEDAVLLLHQLAENVTSQDILDASFDLEEQSSIRWPLSLLLNHLLCRTDLCTSLEEGRGGGGAAAAATETGEERGKDNPLIEWKTSAGYTTLLYHLFCLFDQLWYTWVEAEYRCRDTAAAAKRMLASVSVDSSGTVKLVEFPAPPERVFDHAGRWRQQNGGTGLYPLVSDETIPFIKGLETVFYPEDGPSVKKVPLLDLFRKARPLTNSRRLVHNVMIPVMETDAWFRSFVIQLCLAMLLGNYKYRKSSVFADPSTRICLYRQYHRSQKDLLDSLTSLSSLAASSDESLVSWVFWLNLIYLSPKLLIRATQLYLLYRIHLDPIFYRLCDDLFDVSELASLVDETTLQLIRVFNSSLSTLTRDLNRAGFKEKVEQVVRPDCEKIYMKVNYLPKGRKFLRSLRANNSQSRPFPYFSLLSREHHKALDMIVSRIPPEDPFPELHLFKYLSWLGSSEEAVRALRSLAQQTDQGLADRKTLDLYRRLFPATLQKAVLFDILLRNRTEFRLVLLPSFYASHQLSAIHEREAPIGGVFIPTLRPRARPGVEKEEEEEEEKKMPLRGCYLLFCPLCGKIASRVRSWRMDNMKTTKGKHDSVTVDVLDLVMRKEDKTNEGKGEIEDEGEGEEDGEEPIYCNGVNCGLSRDETALQMCRETKLKKIYMIGRALCLPHAKKYIMICPQPGCGVLSEFDYMQCRETIFGSCCIECSLCLDEDVAYRAAMPSTRSKRAIFKTTKEQEGFLIPHKTRKKTGTTRATSKTVREHFLRPPVCALCEKTMTDVTKFETVSIENHPPLIYCAKHIKKGLLEYQRDHNPPKQIKKEECSKAGHCICSTDTSTCNGAWTPASLAARARVFSGNEMQRIARISQAVRAGGTKHERWQTTHERKPGSALYASNSTMQPLAAKSRQLTVKRRPPKRPRR